MKNKKILIAVACVILAIWPGRIGEDFVFDRFEVGSTGVQEK